MYTHLTSRTPCLVYTLSPDTAPAGQRKLYLTQQFTTKHQQTTLTVPVSKQPHFQLSKWTQQTFSDTIELSLLSHLQTATNNTGHSLSPRQPKSQQAICSELPRTSCCARSGHHLIPLYGLTNIYKCYTNQAGGIFFCLSNFNFPFQSVYAM